MTRTHRALPHIGLSIAGLLLVTVAGFSAWMSSERHLPSEQTARQQFASHRADYARLVSLLRQVPEDRIIGNDGTALDQGTTSPLVPEYRELMQTIGAKFVAVRGDGSVEFALWGFGRAICSDSYMSVLYRPVQLDAWIHRGWTA